MSGMENLSRPDAANRSVFTSIANLFALLATLSALGCLGGPSGSAPPADTLRIGTSGDYHPFSLALAPSQTDPRGFSIDLGEAYAASTGRRVEWVPFVWRTLARDLDEGRFDFALSGVTVRADRSIAGRFSLPVTVSGAVVLVPADGPLADVGTLAGPGLTFAVNAGGHLERTARALFPDARIVPVPDNGSVLDRLEGPGVDAVVTDSLEAPHWQTRRPGLRAIGPLTRDRKAAWFPVGSEDERARFDAWLQAAERDGTLAALRAKHALPADRTAETVAALLALLDDRLSLMTEVARVKQVMTRPIEDRPREATVLDRAAGSVANEAAARGLPAPDEAGIRAFYQAQIEAAKSIQRAWTRANPTSAEAPAPATALEAAAARLADDVRPALLDLGDRIAALLVEAAASDVDAPTRKAVGDALARHALPASDLEAIHASLERVLAADR
ncbi:MAG: transporter substrate-binding domain-containing protein [bacterium]|nr:transporter substrate-binding domain-containing protein [bacterium]